MKKTNRATEFSNDLRTSLDRHKNLSMKIGVDQWKKNWRPTGIRNESVDVVGLRKDSSPLILIEAELRRDDPLCNVLKIWQWAKDGLIKKPFVLFQAFSKAYRGPKQGAEARARFLADRMLDDLGARAKYIPVPFKYDPRKGGKIGAGRRRYHAERLARAVIRRSRKLKLAR